MRMRLARCSSSQRVRRPVVAESKCRQVGVVPATVWTGRKSGHEDMMRPDKQARQDANDGVDGGDDDDSVTMDTRAMAWV